MTYRRAAAAFGLTVVVFVIVYVICAQARLTAAEVERRLDRAFPSGPSRADIEGWLAARGCDWTYAGDPATLRGEAVAPAGAYTGAIRAVLHDTDDCSAPVRTDIQVFFFFGADGRVAYRVVREELVAR